MEVQIVGSSESRNVTGIGIVLPSRAYLSFMYKQRCFDGYEYHALIHSTFNIEHPLDFDAQTFVQDAINYTRTQGLKTVIAFDCFATLLASIITEELGLPGPSFLSAFLCTIKYYGRVKLPSKGVSVWCHADHVSMYPVVVKSGEHQFDTANAICHSPQMLQEALQASSLFRAQLMSNTETRVTLHRRQAFYFYWIHRFHLTEVLGASSPDDIRLAHIEEFVPSLSEYQIEVALTPKGVLVADTGDIIRGEHGSISMFRTPWSLTSHEPCRVWLRDIIHKMELFGFGNGALDIEFIQTSADEFELIEINCRYSFMGFRQPASLSRGTKFRADSLRNLLNRTLLAMGSQPETLPTRDDIGRSLICVYCFTKQTGPIDDILNKEFLATLGGAHQPAFVLKHTQPVIEEHDKSKLRTGYTRVGNFFAALPDNNDAINAFITETFSKSIKNVSKLLPIKVFRDSKQVSFDWLYKPDITACPPPSCSSRARLPIAWAWAVFQLSAWLTERRTRGSQETYPCVNS